jgi:lipid A 4'-phosphatase
LVIADACARNCSFVSGHAAIAFWVTAYAFLVPASHRLQAMGAALGFGSAVALMRVMQGAHFLSDVVYAGVIVVAVNAIGARLILRQVT